LIEVTNFDKFGLLASEGNVTQNKDVKDLAEMRISQIFGDSVQELDKKVRAK
jgi:hypothetical protein